MKRLFYLGLAVALSFVQFSIFAKASSLAQTDTLISVQRLEALERTEANALDAHNLLVEKEKELRQIQVQLGALQKERDKLLEELEKAREKEASQSSHRLKQQIADLEDQLKEMQERAEELSGRNQDNERIIQQLKDEMERQREEYAQTVRQLNEELEGLADIRERWFRQLVSDADSKWLNKSFGQVDAQELADAIAPYRKYAPANQEIAETYEKLQQLFRDVAVYQEGLAALQQPFDLERINSLLGDLQKMQDSVPSFQRTDVDRLVSVLGGYGMRLRNVQFLIQKIDKEYEEGLPGVRFRVDDIVKDENEQYGTIDKLSSYPWLKQQWDGYFEAIKENDDGDNAYRHTIMNLKTR